MQDFATDFAAGSGAPLSFDRAANPNGLPPVIEGGVLRLAVQRGAYPDATAGEPRTTERCEMREPGKVPFAVATRHRFALRVPPGFPRVRRRCVLAQLKRNADGGSPLWALRIEDGRLFCDWRLPGLAVEHHDSLAATGAGWTQFDLTVSRAGAELRVDGLRLTRIRHVFGPPDRTRYLKIGPYRDQHPDWGDGPAALEVRDVRRTVLVEAADPIV